MNLKSKLPSVSLVTLRILVVVGFFVAISFVSGYLIGQKRVSAEKQFPFVTISRDVPQNRGTLDFSLFWKVWDTLDASYFDKTKLIPAKMVYGAISGMVSAIGDPYTAFLPPEENKIVQEDLRGNFDGVGIQIGYRGSQLAVIAPLPNSPAERAGVKAGDYIIGIKDEAKGIDMGTAGLSLPDAVSAIRGPRGTKVSLTLLRDGAEEPISVDITRETIDVPSVTVTFVGEGETLAHIKLLKFGGETNGEWTKAVNDIKSKNISGIILDLRNNPGGYLQGSVDIASNFLPTDTVVVIEEDGDGTREEFRTSGQPMFGSTPMVVLVNKGSASASEILAGALRDQRKIRLVGDTTFGKGTIQEPKQINGGSGLHITIARWLTPTNVWVHDKGLIPDVKIEDDSETPEDEQLEAAISALQN